jgi:hypothetical protein
VAATPPIQRFAKPFGAAFARAAQLLRRDGMSDFEMLRQGSPFHKVHINSERAITILPIDDGDDDWIRFQQVVAEVEENAGDEYEVLPHPVRTRDLPGWPPGRPVYDMAAVTLI